ncbi:uncharacterized protein METZ01_LOCUS68734 [marine metagenome]|jgi:hypothetical protein|uniref:DUF1552 domain-containing protein n=1 Tax=marine metagenome TaxID=408172 RepID=A0A381TIK4_9ZZZZ|tara:strand:+ start:5549 stop:6883 length:1335 start_codon:yes stop_codon:yes gene_type:complete
MNIKSKSLSRRTALRGMGAMLTLPYLDIMGNKTLAAASNQSDPSRLACFYIPGAINHYNWFPKDTGPNYTLAPSHKPLAKHRDNFSVLTSLLHIQGRISGHEHPYNWLTGTNIKQTPGTVTNTISMDQVAAKYAGPTYVPSLALSFTNGVGTTTLSRNAMGADIPATADYRAVFSRLFPPADKAQIQEAKARIALDRSVLDTAVGDIKRFQGKLGHADRQRVEQYLTSIREVEQRMQTRVSIIDKGRPEFDEKSVRLEPAVKNSMQEHIELMMDLIALSFQTDMTRVVTHSLGGEGGPNYDDYKVWSKSAGASLRGAHDFHHKGSGNRGADNVDVKVLGQRDAMFCASLARLMDKLKSIEAHEGTLLDHTVLLLGGSQISSHNGGSFPMLLAGGRKLGFKHGQHIKWPGGTKPASDLYLTILQQMGCPVKSFKESSGPIGEILS